MAVHSFSTKAKNTKQDLAVKEVKRKCEARCLVFSSLVVQLLVQWNEEDNKVENSRRT